MTPNAIAPDPGVVAVFAPSASPAHPDFASLIAGIGQILNADTPAIINLFPSPKIGVVLVGTQLGLSFAAQLLQLLALLHPPKPVPAAPVSAQTPIEIKINDYGKIETKRQKR